MPGRPESNSRAISSILYFLVSLYRPLPKTKCVAVYEVRSRNRDSLYANEVHLAGGTRTNDPHWMKRCDGWVSDNWPREDGVIVRPVVVEE